ncbi:MAG: tetratricopeptide repeat protein [bacterium]
MKKCGLVIFIILVVGCVVLFFGTKNRISRNTNSVIHTYAGIALEKIALWDPAELQYRAALKSDPGNASALKGLAMVYFGKKRYDSAVTFINRALSKDKHWVKGYLHRAKVFEAKKDFPYAIASYKKYLAESPDLSSASRYIIEQKISKLSTGI